MLIRSRLNNLLLLFVFLASASLCEAQQSIEIKQYSSNQGILQPFIYSINQDDKGYLWVGTGEGIFKYNGFEYKPVYAGDSLAENYISVGYTDNEKGIWWGHQEGGVTHYKNGEFTIIKHKNMPEGRVNAIKQDSLGNIWYATQEGGIVKLAQDEAQVFQKPFNNMILQDFEFAYSGLLLVGADEGLYLYQIPKNGLPFKILKIKEIPNTKINHISKAIDKDTYWIGTEDEGLYKIKVHPKTKGFIEVIGIGEGYNLNNKNIKHILEDRNGNLWISTYGDGIFKASYSVSTSNYIDIQNIGQNFALQSLDINCVFEDREGSIWAGSHGGSLYFIKDNLFEQYIETLDASNFSNVRSILVDEDFYYYGSDGKVIIEKKSDNTSLSYDTLSGLPNDLITSMYMDNKRNLWVGTDKFGAFVKYKASNKFEPLNLSLDNLSNSVNSISGGSQFIWIATKFGLFKYNRITKDFEKYSTENELKHNNISHLYKDPNTDDIWVATQSNYLSRIRGDEITDFEIEQSSSILNISSVHGDSNGNIWVATLGNGVYKFNITTKTFQHLDMSNQLLSEYSYSLIVDDNNNVWVGHRGGISRIDVNELTVRTYDQTQGFKGDCFPNAVFRDGDNNIWFGTNNGAFKFVQAKDKVNTIAPLTDLIRVVVNSGNEESIFSSGNIELPYSTYKIRFEFIGLSFKNSADVTYEYMLEGHDVEWTRSSTNNFAQYSGIQEGKYTFKVRSCNSDGFCSIESTEFNLTILTPFWKKWWFIALCALFFMLVIILFIRYREKRQRAFQEYLQSELDNRTKEVVHQKEELERKNKDITDSINYAKRIQKAVIPTLKDLSTHLPNSYIYFKPRDIVSGDFYWIHKPSDDIIIVACADATGHGVPGAFMSLIGSTIMKDTAKRNEIASPQEILETLEIEVKGMLTSDGDEENPKDGMDISVCEINIKTRQIRLCSAMRPVFLMINNELVNVKPNRNPIGGGYKNFVKEFKMDTIQLNEGDGIYMFTDGYPDQFGGPRGKKLKISKLKQIIIDGHGKPPKEQYEIMDREFSLWTEGYKQIDDVLVMGITV